MAVPASIAFEKYCEENKNAFTYPFLLTDEALANAERHLAQGDREKVFEIIEESGDAFMALRERGIEARVQDMDKGMASQDMFDVSKQLPRLVAEAGKAAEVRALGLATAEALVQQRAAELADVISRAEEVKVPHGGREDTHSLLQVARANTAVAQAMEELAKAELRLGMLEFAYK